ncbi:phosphohistidine phosphatase [Raineyella antarctica]|uniref:Phosphohistidine phosphatase n=1 Tax=Raineyella antarctica TaxID=1577474 RepID=A0A1G6IIK4_9ACTN|nr:histidine phosphatase family protein [Raineyella antarctica]SDC06243.1 phosphohistidine phosphatase [Raineyella antarctica]
MDQRPSGTSANQHVLYLMRHAKAEELHPGDADHTRELTERGRGQARAVGEWLEQTGEQIDRVLCSEAARARQTLEDLGIDAPAEYRWELYNSGADRILDQLRKVDEDVRTVLVVAHAPGIPALTWDLVEPISSDQGARATIAHHFPAATIVRLEFSGTWQDLESARLTHARVD